MFITVWALETSTAFQLESSQTIQSFLCLHFWTSCVSHLFGTLYYAVKLIFLRWGQDNTALLEQTSVWSFDSGQKLKPRRKPQHSCWFVQRAPFTAMKIIFWCKKNKSQMEGQFTGKQLRDRHLHHDYCKSAAQKLDWQFYIHLCISV